MDAAPQGMLFSNSIPTEILRYFHVGETIRFRIAKLDQDYLFTRRFKMQVMNISNKKSEQYI